MYEALDAGRIVAPDLSLLGGVLTVEGDGACEKEGRDAEFIKAPAEASDNAPTMTPTEVTLSPVRSSKSS